jgi:NADPH2:quinone reductase
MADAPDPVAGEGEVVIAVKAAGVNFPDALIIEDKYQFKPERPFAPGGEVAGVVESVGAGVTHVKVGQRVIGSIRLGRLRREDQGARRAHHADPGRDAVR